MIATAPTTIPVVEHTYTTVLTPKGEAVVQLIRANWLSDYASPQVRNERFADIAVDPANGILVSGSTGINQWPADENPENQPQNSAFVACLAPSGKKVFWTRFVESNNLGSALAANGTGGRSAGAASGAGVAAPGKNTSTGRSAWTCLASDSTGSQGERSANATAASTSATAACSSCW